jgi:hypothetical protein
VLLKFVDFTFHFSLSHDAFNLARQQKLNEAGERVGCSKDSKNDHAHGEQLEGRRLDTLFGKAGRRDADDCHPSRLKPVEAEQESISANRRDKDHRQH